MNADGPAPTRSTLCFPGARVLKAILKTGEFGVGARYLTLAYAILGPDWATPACFRIGASSLLIEIRAALDAVPVASEG